jgi:tetratricopeptide (TPR) repeat protein
VRLFSGEGTDRKREWKAEAKMPRLPYPDGKAALTRGKTYHRQVTAVVGGGQQADVVRSKFTIATEEEAQFIAAMQPLAKEDDPSSWLLAATLYDSYGALNEALPLLEKVAEKRPDQGNLLAALAVYYARAGRPEKAAEARKRAEKLGVKASDK